MRIKKESFNYLKNFVKSLDFNKKWISTTEILIATAIQTIIENIEYENKSYIEKIKEIYKREKNDNSN